MSINTNNISINNFNNICRTCAQINDLISIPENIYLIEMLSTSVQHLQIQLNDDLPQQICINCIKDLNQSYTFIGKCKAADAAFRQCLAQQKLINLTQNHEKNKPENVTTEEIFIKTEFPVNDDCDNCSDSPQYKSELEDKNQHEIDQLNECVTTNNDVKPHLSDCQLENLNETMEMEENRDDEDPLDVTTCSLPEKSRAQYKRERKLFDIYCKQKNVSNITEPVVLDYFLEKSKTMKSSSVWSSYSFLKKTLILDDNIDISKYTKLLAFLKRNSVGYKANVSKAFTRDQINKFLHEAPDEIYLMMKVAMIMGIVGGCQRDELIHITLDHIEDKDTVLIVTVPTPKTNRSRSFTVTNYESDWLSIYRKYYKCRVSFNTDNRRLFLNYKNGKLTSLPVGKNTFGKFPKLVAEYLNLANPAQYTGHCFRRTSALLFNRRWDRKPREDSD